MLSRRLKEEGLWQTPSVFFWEEHKFDNIEKLRQIVMRHEGNNVPLECRHLSQKGNMY